MEEELRALVKAALFGHIGVDGSGNVLWVEGEGAQQIAFHVPSGVDPGTLVNWAEQPQGGRRPFIVMLVVDDAEGLHMNGPDGLFQGRVQLDCYATTYGEAKNLSRAVRAVLHGYRSGGFRLVQHVATRDAGREGGTNEAERLFRVSLDFLTNWRE